MDYSSRIAYWNDEEILGSYKTKNLKMKISLYKTIILPVVLYGCETWSLTLRGESRQRVFEKRILRRIFGPIGDVNGEGRRFDSEEIHSLYSSTNIVS